MQVIDFDLRYLCEKIAKYKNAIVFGAGKAGKEVISGLKLHNIDIIAVFSNNPERDQPNINGIKICYPNTHFESLNPVYVIAVINDTYQREMKDQLIALNINIDNIISLGDIKYEYYSSLNKVQRKERLSELYRVEFGRNLNWNNPVLYSEILNYEKIYLSPEIVNRHTILADKIAVREYVKERIGEGYIPGLLGVWEKADEIDYDSLPNSFVLKCNHGSGMNFVVKNKSELNWEDAKYQLDYWVNHCYPYIAGNYETQYEKIPRKIFCEEYIDGMNSTNPQYDVFCFYGQPKWIWRLRSPHTSDERGRFYSTEWKPENFYFGYPLDEEIVPPPENLTEILNVAKKLSEGIRHVRVDIYELSDKTLKFSELTFTSWSGLKRFVPDEYDLKFGKLILEAPNELQRTEQPQNR